MHSVVTHLYSPESAVPNNGIALGISSRFLIESLNKHGYCSSYKEVIRLGKCSAINQVIDIPNCGSQCVQYPADNVEHNIRTIDGANTFHGMGIIAIITPCTTLTRAVPRAQVSSNRISSVGAIQILYHRDDNKALADLQYQEVPSVVCEDPTVNLDVLW